MEPIVIGTASPGNVGRDFDVIRQGVATRIVSVVRERLITEWKEMHTDDPIGAVILPRNSITLRLRLMRLQPPALAADVTFRNRARLTLNQKAIRLLDGRFTQAVLDLVLAAQ